MRLKLDLNSCQTKDMTESLYSIVNDKSSERIFVLVIF